MAKRYLLFVAKSDLSEEDMRQFSNAIRAWHRDAKVIQVKGNTRAVIVRTTNEVVPRLREAKPGIRAGRVELETVLTSGAIGNLKKRASEPKTNGKVP